MGNGTVPRLRPSRAPRRVNEGSVCLSPRVCARVVSVFFVREEMEREASGCSFLSRRGSLFVTGEKRDGQKRGARVGRCRVSTSQSVRPRPLPAPPHPRPRPAALPRESSSVALRTPSATALALSPSRPSRTKAPSFFRRPILLARRSTTTMPPPAALPYKRPFFMICLQPHEIEVRHK